MEDKELTPKDVSIKLNERLEINCQKDKRGIFVRGTGKVISDEEKLAVINYILNKRIPLTDGTYESGLARVKKNVFDLDKAENEKYIHSYRKRKGLQMLQVFLNSSHFILIFKWVFLINLIYKQYTIKWSYSC